MTVRVGFLLRGTAIADRHPWRGTESRHDRLVLHTQGYAMPTTTSEKSLEDHSAGLIEQIESRIRRRVGSRLSDLHVTIQCGALVLQGRTLTHHAKQLALQAAMESSELPILANEILVRQDIGLDP
jgi:hypothetical protein